ncbi:MAG: SUF system NifU family Fe-S cluster assembly protein [Bacteroidetes bacterium]|nr:SUF system NifU family Fe-S cluster assembly protein [Bacteroidota bacterium]
MDTEKEELYQALILDHDQAPRHFHRLDPFSHTAEAYNPLCGDRYTIYLDLNSHIIRQISFEGYGCAISKASASMMTSMLSGASFESALALFSSFRTALLIENPPSDDSLGDLITLTGVISAPTRIKCALLPWEAACTAIQGASRHAITPETTN